MKEGSVIHVTVDGEHLELHVLAVLDDGAYRCEVIPVSDALKAMVITIQAAQLEEAVKTGVLVAA